MTNNDNFPERIEFAISKLNGPSEFSRQTGVTLSTITRWRKGEAEPTRTNLIKIAEAAKIRLEWLALGTGAPDQDTKTINTTESPYNDDYFEEIDDFRNIKVAAGFGAFNEELEANKTKVEKAWLQARGLKAKHCAMFTVDGESMYPTLKDGEEIIVDRSKRELREGKIFILNNQGAMLVKKIQIDFNSVDLISDNPIYKPITLSQDEANHLIIIGQVVRGYRDF
jgi:putative phage repressor|nr:MAG TPA: Repressor protein CI [Caudoviricetes sp.]